MKKYYFDSSGLIELYEKRLDLFENIIDKMKKENIFVSEIVDEEIKGKFEKYIHTSELKIDENLSEKIIKNYIKRLTALHDQLENFDVENELEGYINAINDLNHRPLKDAVDNFKKKANQIKVDRKNLFQNTHFSYEIIPFSFKERVEAIDEAKKRFENQIPPGYLDYQTKEKRIDEYNDFFIWKSMLNHAKNNMSSDICYFVTNDKKDCNNEIDKFYLEKEFYEETVQNIKIISSDEFLEEIGYKTIECSEIENEINRKLEEYPNDVLLESSLAGEILKLFDNGMNEIKNIELDKPDIKIICAEIYAMNIYKVNAKIFYGTELSTSEYKNYFKVYLNCEMFYYIDTKAISINIVSYNLDSITEFINEIKFINQRFKVNNKKLFDFVKFRDNYTCQICGRDRLYDNSIILHIHHIIPKNKGGETCAENLTTVCNNCNRKLGDKFHLN